MRLKNRMSIEEYLYELDRLKLLIADCKYKILCFQLGAVIDKPLSEIEQEMNDAEKYLYRLQDPLSTV